MSAPAICGPRNAGRLPRDFGVPRRPKFRGADTLVRAVLTATLLATIFVARRLPAQEAAPTLTVNEDCTAFAIGPGGRIVYSVRRVFGERSYDLQRDDFYLSDPGKKDRQIINGRRMFPPGSVFSYVVHNIRWAPDGSKLAAELFTTAVLERRGPTKEQAMTLLFDPDGREIKMPGSGSLIPDAVDPAWLGDGATLMYLVEENKTLHQFAMDSVKPVAGGGQRLFQDSLFLAVAWLAQTGQAVAVLADAQFTGRPRLVFLDLAKQDMRELAVLEGYSGGLTVSPSGKQVALFRDPEHFELRSISDPQRPRSMKLLMGEYLWSPDEQRILLKSAVMRKSGSLQWIRLSDGNAQDLFHGLAVYGMSLSPDGRLLGTMSPGKHVLAVYPLSGLL